MSKLIIFDFEVFKYNTLLGAIVIDGDNVDVHQLWHSEEIKQFYLDNMNSIWIGQNISHYDNFILQAVMKDQNPFKVSKEIIEEKKKKYLNIRLIHYDLMSRRIVSLKTLELVMGKRLSVSGVDFNIDRPLTDDEIYETELYNLDDLEQTLANFLEVSSEFSLRLDIINEFNLDIKMLSATGTKLSAEVLGAERDSNLKYIEVEPIMHESLRLANKELLEYYSTGEFKARGKFRFEMHGVKHVIGVGGIHGAEPRCYADWALYFDVGGYYNTIMINLGLLPRSIPDKGKAKYKWMFEQQLEMKAMSHIPEIGVKRKAYKPILLAVFGAMLNEYTDFYDPWHGELVTMTGQLFLVDLLEKLEGKIKLIQSNTDGIIAAPLEGVTEAEIIEILDEWQKRTGFDLEVGKTYNIYQRDVNNYIMQDDKGRITTKGEAVKHYNGWKSPYKDTAYESKDPLIIHHCIVDYLIHDIPVEDTVANHKDNLRLYQKICKKGTFNYLEYTVEDLETGEVKREKTDNTVRAFAWNSTKYKGSCHKHKEGKTSVVSNLPDSVFIYNEEILSEETVKRLQEDIDWQYYIDRAYERLRAFIIPEIKGFVI